MNTSPRKATLVFIFITVLLDMLALGVIIPVLPKLIVQFEGGNIGEGAKVYGLFATIWALMHFIASPISGSLSDRFGRRPVILLSNFGLGLDYVLMALAPSIGWLFTGRVLSGITAASIPAAYAYIADVTTPEKRAAGYGMLGAAFGVGFVLGPALGGLLGGIDPRMPFWAAAGLSLLNAAYGFFILPESLKPENRAPFSWKNANPVGSLVLLKSRPGLMGFAWVKLLGGVAHVALPAVFVLYASYRYGWDEKTIGLTLAGVGVCSAIIQGGLVGPIVKKVGEANALLLGSLAGALGFLVYGLAPTGAIFWFGVPLMSLWGITGPALQGLMTLKVSAHEQGQLQGANGSLMGISELIGPAIFTTLFASFLEFPGAPFVLASFLLFASLFVALAVLKKEKI